MRELTILLIMCASLQAVYAMDEKVGDSSLSTTTTLQGAELEPPRIIPENKSPDNFCGREVKMWQALTVLDMLHMMQTPVDIGEGKSRIQPEGLSCDVKLISPSPLLDEIIPGVVGAIRIDHTKKQVPPATTSELSDDFGDEVPEIPAFLRRGNSEK